MKIISKVSKTVVGFIVGMAFSCGVQAANLTSISMCALLVLGEGGIEHKVLMDYQAAALNWGVKIEVKPYSNENIIMEELKANVCDLASMSGMLTRNFNKFTGTLDSPGSIPTYDHLKI